MSGLFMSTSSDGILSFLVGATGNRMKIAFDGIAERTARCPATAPVFGFDVCARRRA